MGALAAGISAGASLLGGITGGKGAAKAARIQAQAYQQGIAEQQREFNTAQQNFAPYLAGGDQALTGTLNLLGLNGDAAQGAAIDALKASPAFTSLYNTGADTILQNAAATGGLRGGNTNNSLAQFGSNLLASVIQNQLSNLGGLVNVGSGAVGNLGSLGQSNANAVADLLAKQGNAQAIGASAMPLALGNSIASMGNALGNYLQSSTGGFGQSGISSNYGTANLAPIDMSILAGYHGGF